MLDLAVLAGVVQDLQRVMGLQELQIQEAVEVAAAHLVLKLVEQEVLVLSSFAIK